MSDREQYEILILGSGAAGKLLAWTMAGSGRRTAVIERRWIGGSCPNIACLPSKNEIWSAKVAHLARNASQFGTRVSEVTVDMAAVRRRKREMVEREVAAHLENYRTTGVELIQGVGRFVAPKTLEVRLNDGGTRIVAGEKVFLDVGTTAAIPAVPGLQAAQPLTHIEALELGYLPSHLLVLGGGFVGLELAQAYRRFGSCVTVIQHGAHLMRGEDSEVASEIEQILIDEGIRVLVGAETTGVHGRSGERVALAVRTPSGEETIEGSEILVATGRVPNTAGIGLEEAGVAIDDRGYVRVNDRLETTASDVWAMGECAGSPQFTHASADDFRIVNANLAGGHRSTRDRLIPSCMFTDPPLARVGMTESEARRRGIAVQVASLPMTAVLRAHTTDETRGFMKVLVGESDARILGFAMIGSEAGEVVAAVQMAMLAKLPYHELRDAILAHPTMAEGLGPLLGKLPAAQVV